MKDEKKLNFNVFTYVYRGFAAKKFRHALTVLGLTLAITFLILVLSMARGFMLEVEGGLNSPIDEEDGTTVPGVDDAGKEATKFDREVQKTIIMWLIVTSAFIIIASTAIISNTMYLSVRERRKEIGILKAVGLTDLQVAKIFITESIWLCVLAWLIALFSGTIISGNIFNNLYVKGSSPLFFTPARAMPEILLIAFLVTVIVGALSALYPAMKAARMDPVSAISPGE